MKELFMNRLINNSQCTSISHYIFIFSHICNTVYVGFTLIVTEIKDYFINKIQVLNQVVLESKKEILMYVHYDVK